VLSGALAGSAPRGRTPAEDERLARALRESKKEQAEHDVVRRAVLEALAPVCESLDAPEAPGLLRLDGIQHLHTPVTGELRAGADGELLALAGRLHPTPAVGGAPSAAARAFLADHEGLDRGGYAGGVGWLGASGDGELMVALRCALLEGRRATLLAGAGIVAGSDPDAELAETCLKLRAALAALVDL
jgi:isochorismate synthase EntC